MQAAISRFFRQEYVFILACVATLTVYSGFFGFGHISWDDPEMVFRNDAVHQFDIKSFFTRQFVGNYIPVTMLFHSLTWQLFGGWDAGHHFLNIIFHLLNGYLLLLAGRKIFQDKAISEIAALLFLLHPLQVESVGWISEFKTVLAATFFLSGFLTYLKWTETNRLMLLAVTLLLFVLACLSKPSAIVFPISMLCADLMTGKRILKKNLLIYFLFFVPAIVFGLLNIRAQTEAQFINHAHEFPLWQRFGFAGYALLRYFILFVFPNDLSVIYPYPEAKATVFTIGFLCIGALIALSLFLIKRHNHLWLGVLVFIVSNLVLVLQFIPFGEVLYADRYMYLSVAGIGWTAGWFIRRLQIQTQYVMFGLILLFSILSFGRSMAWKNALHLYEDILKKYPNEFIALNSAGVECMFMNDDNKALDYFNRAVTAESKNYKGYYNRGLLYLKNNEPKEAIQSFNASIAIYDYAKAYAGRAAAYYQLDDFSKAMEDARKALSLDPGSSRAYFVMGNSLNNLNRLDEAMDNYNKAIQIDPKEADYFFKRSIVWGKRQDFKSCLADLDLCVSLRPDYYEAYYWRGVAKVNLKMNACSDLEMAARHNYEPAVNAFNKYCR